MENDSVDDVLAHYGVPGMRWGRRKVETLTGRGKAEILKKPTEVEVKVPGPNKKIVTSGGQNHLPVHDATKTAATIQLAKASGVRAVETKDLNEAVKRIKAEQAFVQAITPKPSGWQAAKEFVKGVIVDQGKAEVRSLAQGSRGPAMKYLDTSLATKKAKHRKTA